MQLQVKKLGMPVVWPISPYLLMAHLPLNWVFFYLSMQYDSPKCAPIDALELFLKKKN